MHSDERHLDASYGCQRLVLMGFAWGTARIMNAVEIEEAISSLAEQPFDGDEFPFAFLMAFGNKATTIKRLRSGSSNKSDLGGILQTNNIHLNGKVEQPR